MAKRFGRQQKRKMRDRIQALEAKVQISEMIGYRNQEIVRETAEILGNHFVSLPPNHVLIQDLESVWPSWRMPLHRRLSPGNASSTFCENVLPILDGSVHTNEIAKHCHIKFELAGHMVACAIKPETLYLMGKGNAHRYLVVELAEQLAYHLEKSIFQTQGAPRV